MLHDLDYELNHCSPCSIEQCNKVWHERCNTTVRNNVAHNSMEVTIVSICLGAKQVRLIFKKHRVRKRAPVRIRSPKCRVRLRSRIRTNVRTSTRYDTYGLMSTDFTVCCSSFILDRDLLSAYVAELQFQIKTA